MAADDWWTGSPRAGLDRALSTGMLPPPGTMPIEMENAYRMAPEKHDPLDFDYEEKMRTQPTRGQLVQGWQAQATQAAADRQAQADRRTQSEMASNLKRLAAGAGRTGGRAGPLAAAYGGGYGQPQQGYYLGQEAVRRKKKRPTAKDMGDALAGWEEDEYARLNAQSGLL